MAQDISGFKSLIEHVRSTLLDLIMVWQYDSVLDFEDTFRNVGIVRDREPSEIRKNVSLRLQGLRVQILCLNDSVRIIQPVCKYAFSPL